MNFNFLKYTAAIYCFLFTTSFTLSSATINTHSIEAVYQANKPKTHTVIKGETVFSIARTYNLAVSDIYAANPKIKAEVGIKIGDTLTIPTTPNSTANTTRTYTVKLKETLYSIAKEHGVKVDDIIMANPDLKFKPLSDGQVLRIPPVAAASTTPASYQAPAPTPVQQAPKSQFTSHKVASKETIYSISKLYNVSADAIVDFNPDLKNGLKEGSTIIIPILIPASNQPVSPSPLQDVNNISIGIVLPFINKSDGQSARFVEYYEGFLLALSQMKAKGFSANVYAFDMGSDIGTDKLRSLLDTYEMKYLDLIIGGVSPQQVTTISDFAKRQNIKYVVPFPTKTNEALNNPLVFQVNAPHSTLYSYVARSFVNLFEKANIIYLTENGKPGDRSELTDAINLQLPRLGITAKAINAEKNLKASLSSVLDLSRKNVIVPTSASIKMLKSTLTALKSISEERSGINISLFGHSDWQTYEQHIKEYSDYDTYIYSPFYIKEDDTRTVLFELEYKKWYSNKSLINTFPKYGVLGYDTGMAFMTAFMKNGKNINNDINSLSVSSLQTPFLFKKEAPENGYMNTGFYLIHYKADGSIVKTEYGR